MSLSSMRPMNPSVLASMFPAGVVLSLTMATGCPKAAKHAPDGGSEARQSSLTQQGRPQADAGNATQPVKADAASSSSPWRGLSLSCPVGRRVQTERYSVGGATWCETPKGTRDGPYASWLNETDVEEVGAYRDGRKDGLWTRYQPYGALSSRGTYVAGLREGLWTWWWPLEAPPEGGQHLHEQRQDEGHFHAGRAVGRWLSWDEHGKPLRHIDAQRTLNDLGARLERYINAGDEDDLQAALNVFRRLPEVEKTRLAKNPEVEKVIQEAIATDGAGITKAESEQLRAELR